MKTIELIYTEEELQEIQQKGEEHDLLCWWFGDKAIQAWRKLQSVKSRIVNDSKDKRKISVQDEIKVMSQTQQGIFDELGERAGKTGRTIRYYYNLSKFYIGDVRILYEVLPLSHYEFAMRFPGFDEDILEFSLRSMDGNGGKPRSVNYLFANLSKIINDQELLKSLGLVQDVESVVEYADFDQVVQEQPQDQPERIHPIAFHFLQSVRKTTDFWKKGIEKWGVPDEEQKNELLELIQTLEEKISLLAGVEKEKT